MTAILCLNAAIGIACFIGAYHYRSQPDGLLLVFAGFGNLAAVLVRFPQ